MNALSMEIVSPAWTRNVAEYNCETEATSPEVSKIGLPPGLPWAMSIQAKAEPALGVIPDELTAVPN